MSGDRISDVARLWSTPHGRWQAAALMLLTAAAFLPTLQADFVLDDEVAIVHNELLRSGHGLWQIWFEPSLNQEEGHYWPLVYTSLWLDHLCWGLDPLGYHVHNLLLHIINVLLLWRLLLRFNVAGAWFGAALFALHPVHVESVVWAIERKDVLSTLFYFLAFGACMQWYLSRGKIHYTLAVVCYVAALLSKSMTVTLPVAVLIGLWWKGGWRGIEGRSPMREGWGPKPSVIASDHTATGLALTRSNLVALLPFCVIGLALVSFDFWLMHAKTPGSYPWTFVERGLIAGRSLTFYLRTLAWPVDLLLIYPRWGIDGTDWRAWLYPLAVLALLAGLWWKRDRIGRGPLAALLFFLVTLAPVLGFIDFSYMGHAFVADRYLYLASAGPLALAAAVAMQLRHHLPQRGQATATMAAAAVLAVLGVLTWQQASLYRNPQVLFRDTLAGNPSSPLAQFHLGWALLKDGSFEDAAYHFEEGLRLQPDHNHTFAQQKLTEALVRAGLDHDAAGRRREARGFYLRVLQREPREPRAAHNLAWILATHPDPEMRDGDEAIRLVKITIKHLGEERPEVLGTAAAAYAEAGRFEEAIETAQRAVELAGEHRKNVFVEATLARIAGYRQRRPVRINASDAAQLPHRR